VKSGSERSSESSSEERQRAQQLEQQPDAEEEWSGERKRRAEGMSVGVTGAGWERTDKKCSLRYAGPWEGRVRVRGSVRTIGRPGRSITVFPCV
jgi:hypothetical protein